MHSKILHCEWMKTTGEQVPSWAAVAMPENANMQCMREKELKKEL